MSKHYRQMAGLPMFDPGARKTDPETSHEAAESMRDTAESQRKKILDYLKAHCPMTADELDDFLGLRVTSAGRRLPELLRAGQVERLPETRATLSGRQAHLWGATQPNKEAPCAAK